MRHLAAGCLCKYLRERGVRKSKSLIGIVSHLEKGARECWENTSIRRQLGTSCRHIRFRWRIGNRSRTIREEGEMESERNGKEEEKYKEKKTGVREKDKRRTERSLWRRSKWKEPSASLSRSSRRHVQSQREGSLNSETDTNRQTDVQTYKQAVRQSYKIRTCIFNWQLKKEFPTDYTPVHCTKKPHKHRVGL